MTSTPTTPAEPADKRQTIEQVHRSLVSQCSHVLKALFFGVLTLGCLLPQFDTSAKLVSSTFPATAALRWDAFHFLHIAENGYMYEHEWAFLPGVSYLMRIARHVYKFVAGRYPSPEDTLWPAIVAAIAVDSSQLVYSLSLHHLKSPHLALLSALLSMVPTSPMTLLFAPYNEPFFTHLSLRGMLCCARKEWGRASLWFALACMFRSNGILLGGFIIWGLVIEPLLCGHWPGSRVLFKTIVFTAIAVVPFIAYQVYAYSIFCTDESAGRAPTWCTHFPPSIYTYVQSEYWNVGFMRYWTFSQLPNFILATPSLALISAFALHHLRRAAVGRLGLSKQAERPDLSSNFLNPSITPYAVHALVFTFIILFMSHTQIILRLAASLPIVHWAGAWLMMEHPLWGRLWVFWSLLWGTVSLLLWAAFLPPA